MNTNELRTLIQTALNCLNYAEIDEFTARQSLHAAIGLLNTPEPQAAPQSTLDAARALLAAREETRAYKTALLHYAVACDEAGTGYYTDDDHELHLRAEAEVRDWEDAARAVEQLPPVNGWMRFKVASRTQAGVKHDVRINRESGNCVCTCPGHFFSIARRVERPNVRDAKACCYHSKAASAVAGMVQGVTAR